MSEYRIKMGENGRVTLPISCRKLLHLKPGEELILRVKEEDGELYLTGVRQSLKKSQALVQKKAGHQSLVERLKRLRQEEG